VVKTRKIQGFAGRTASIPSVTPRRSGSDDDSPPGKADDGARERLFEPRETRFGRRSRCAVEAREQGFRLAKFRRPLMTEPVNRTQQQTQPDFLR
jgi:hypothetical protein